MEVSDLDDLVDCARRHHLDIHPGLYHAVYHTHVDNRAAVGVVLAVENQALQGGIPVPLRRGNVVYDHLEHGVDVDAVFCRDLGRIHRRKADHVLDLMLDLLGSCRGQVDLIDDGQHLEAIVDGKIGIRERLRFNALRRIHNQHRTLARRKGAGYLIVEIDMSGCINQVKLIFLPILRAVNQTNRLRFDGDSSFALQIHVIQNLLLHFSIC